MTVTGAGFDSSHVVKLDGSDICETQSVSLTNIICVVPAVSVDPVDVGAGWWVRRMEWMNCGLFGDI